MKRIYFLAIFLLGIFISPSAQLRCAAYDVLQQQMAADPVFARKVRESEKSFVDYQRKTGREPNAKPPVIKVPVVVHVLYNTPEQNISDAQVQSQITVLNEDFTATNSDYNNYNAGYGDVRGDADIEFCLVQIVRKAVTRKSYPANDQMKFARNGGSDAVNPMNALNIWVCNLGQNLLGYAQFPGGAANTFGVVCHYRAFGRGASYNLFADYNLGRTMTHEIGHCLGLRHIWGDANCGNDFVDDTPLHNTANYGCPEQGHLSTCTGHPLEMFMNYMDYTDDRCMYFLSDGQVSRAGFFIDTDSQLQSIFNSSCTQNATTPLTTSVGNDNTPRFGSSFQVYPTIASQQVNLDFVQSTAGTKEIIFIDLSGTQVLKQVITVTEGRNSRSVTVNHLPNGVYLVRVGNGTEMQQARVVVQH